MTYTKYSASGNDFVIFHSFINKDYSQEAISLMFQERRVLS